MMTSILARGMRQWYSVISPPETKVSHQEKRAEMPKTHAENVACLFFFTRERAVDFFSLRSENVIEVQFVISHKLARS